MSKIEEDILNIPDMKEISLRDAIHVLATMIIEMRQELSDLQQLLIDQGVINENEK